MNLRQINVVAAAIQRSSDGRYLLARRKKTETGGGSWEFPGGKIETGETETQALVREIKEELNVFLVEQTLRFVARHSYDYPNVRVHLSLWIAEVDDIVDYQLLDHDEINWYLVSEISLSELSLADHYFLQFL